jgi:MurNAc alpha-1-phosphate uridylyltransferase
MDDHGRLSRHSITGGAGYVYTGAQIIKTDMLAGLSDEVFSMWRLWEPMIAARRMYGLIHNGGWCDVGQPESIALAEQLLLEQGHV